MRLKADVNLRNEVNADPDYLCLSGNFHYPIPSLLKLVQFQTTALIKAAGLGKVGHGGTYRTLIRDTIFDFRVDIV